MHDQVRVELDDRDFTEVALRPFGVGGSTMRGWSDTDADPMRALLDTLVEDPAPEPVVLLTLGGNDLLDAAASADRVRDDLRRVVSALADARDDVIVVLASYDVVNPAVAPAECRGVFEETLGVTDIADITGAFRRQWAALEATAADLDPVVTVDAFGTLQGRPGDPDVTSPSSVEYLQDCLHLNDDGHDLYLDEVFDQALTPVLCRTEDAAVCGR